MPTSAPTPVNTVLLASNNVPPFRPVYSVPKKLELPPARVSVPVWLAFKTPADVAVMLGLKEKFPAPANVKVFAPKIMPLNPPSVAAELLFVHVWFAPIVTAALFVISKVTFPAVAAIVMPPAPMVIFCSVTVVD